MGVLTYTFIYTSSRNTYLIILFLEACTNPLYALRYSYHLTLAVAAFIFHSNLYLNMCSVELPGAYLLWIMLLLHHDIHSNISRLIVTPVISINHGWRRTNRTNSTVVSQKSTLQAYQRCGLPFFRVFPHNVQWSRGPSKSSSNSTQQGSEW